MQCHFKRLGRSVQQQQNAVPVLRSGKPSRMSMQATAVAEAPTASAVTTTVKLPTNHIESSKKALELLKEQQVNR